MRKTFAKGRLKTYAKTERPRRRVPLSAKVLDALVELSRRDGIVFTVSEGGRINIDNVRSREWCLRCVPPACRIAGSTTCATPFATWSLAAGMSIFTLAWRMGTSVQMIDRTYRHLAQDAEDRARGLLDAYDAASDDRGPGCGHDDRETRFSRAS
jgi:hypothetical protein